MSEAAVRLPDAEARRRIAADLDTNFLVEAGAGSGKTTGLVDRMLGLVVSGKARVEQIAAVTFTRKAAAQLRERFQVELEKALAKAADPAVRGRLEQALAGMDRSFLGTIHSFCARLLRERAVEAGVDVDFRELEELEDALVAEGAWQDYLEVLRLQGSAEWGLLDAADVQPADLLPLYRALVASPDIEPYRQEVPRPHLAPVAEALRRFVAEAERRLPARPEKGWDDLQELLRRVIRLSRVLDLSDDRHLLRVLGLLTRKPRMTQNRWPSPQAGKEAADWLAEFQARHVVPTLTAWREYRHGLLLKFVLPAVEHYAERRREMGVLSYQDLLMGAARLLRQHPHVRRYFAGRYPYLLVDEFQDTDPVQVEIVMLLAGEPVTEPDWRRVRPRPGSLFVVGDPKQSIYRFRRADIAVYNEFKERLVAAGGEVLVLTANFRSVPSVLSWANRVVGDLLPPEPDRYQAAAAPLDTVRPTPGAGIFHGVYTLTVPPVGSRRGEDIARADAEQIAAWIAWACKGNVRLPRSEEELAAGAGSPATPGDFLILTWNRRFLTVYAEALEKYGLPFALAGGSGLGSVEEVQQFLVLLRAIADPDDGVLTLAALRGLFFGLPDDLLYRFRTAGGRLHYLRQQPEPVAQAGEFTPVMAALAQLKEFWFLSRNLPAPAAVEQILNALGVVPYLAGGELGDSRAGNLLKLLELVRAGEPGGFAATVERLAEILENADLEEGQLRHGATGVVRLMNLHKAKGLEAPVVFLADPAPLRSPDPSQHVERSAGGAVGYYLVVRSRRYQDEVLAQPPGWEEKQADEQRFAEAERRRLLYVAITRAQAALVVSRYPASDSGPWSLLTTWLDPMPELPKPAGVAPVDRAEASVSPDEVSRALAAVAAAKAAAAMPGYRQMTVTEHAKGGAEPPPWHETEDGVSWGTAVHRLFEALGRDPARQDLPELAARILAETGRPIEETDRLLGVAETLRASPLWARVVAAPARHCEVPLAGVLEDGVLLTGTADLVFREGDGWVLVDYKSDAMAAGEQDAFARFYAPQLRAYARLWELATGEPVRETVIYFTALGEAWPVGD